MLILRMCTYIRLSDEDLEMVPVKKARSRDCFLEIKKALHLIDNIIINNSKDKNYDNFWIY